MVVGWVRVVFAARVAIRGVEDAGSVGVPRGAFCHVLVEEVEDVLLGMIGVFVMRNGVVGPIGCVDEEGELGEGGVVMVVRGDVEGEEVGLIPLWGRRLSRLWRKRWSLGQLA